MDDWAERSRNAGADLSCDPVICNEAPDNQFKDIEKIKEVEKIIIQYDGLAKLKDAKVVSGEQRINREDLSDEFKNVVSFEATNNTKRNILFSSRVFTIKEGKNIEENDKNSIIVHEEFAKQNNLKLGDEVNLELLDIEESGGYC